MTRDTIDKIAQQALEEIAVSRSFKQGKITNWKKNEDLYYNVFQKSTEARASVRLGRMQEFVHALLAKVDNPLVFKFTKRKNSQTQRVEQLNALRKLDAQRDAWDMKDIVGKKQGIIYGRANYWYFADSLNNRYKPHLENIDVYDFLIDPGVGGIDLEQARYMGSYSVELDRWQLKKGAKDKLYMRSAVEELLQGSGNAAEMTPEETNKRQRTQDQDTIGQKQRLAQDRWKFWRWVTTYQGDRVYLLMTPSGQVVRAEYLGDIVPTNSDFPQGMWPAWSWAAFPDLTEFWTPSFCDYVREIIMAQDVTINQMLDNAEAINKPQKVVNTTAIENLGELKYRRDGIIKVKGDVDVQKAVQTLMPPSINTPLLVFEKLENIKEKAGGVTSQMTGTEDVKGKVGIYEGNQAASADRVGLLNKSYSFGYTRFSELWQMGVKEHLIRKEAIEINGPQGVELVEVKRTDLFKRGDVYGLVVEASNAEMLASVQDKKVKNEFLLSETANPIVNRKKLFEAKAELVGYTQDKINELLDTSLFGTASLIAQADLDIENVLSGERVEPNRRANNAYRQHILDYMTDHEHALSSDDWRRLEEYMNALEPVVMKNEARALRAEQMQETRTAMASGKPAAPASPGMPGAPGMPAGAPAAPGTMQQ